MSKISPAIMRLLGDVYGWSPPEDMDRIEQWVKDYPDFVAKIERRERETDQAAKVVSMDEYKQELRIQAEIEQLGFNKDEESDD